ncbi:MAG: MFS transporter [Acidimicrobiales bacterium]
MPGTSPPTAATVLRSLVMPIYLPALAVQTGTAMLLPILPLYLRSIELSYSSIACPRRSWGWGDGGQLPFGHLLARRPEQVVMLASVAVMAATTGVFGWIEITAVLLIARLLWGVGSTGWLLSRQTVMTRATSSSVRGRAMSLFGGTTRLGFFIGPVLGGFAVEALGYPAAFLAAGLVTALGMLPLLTSRQPLPSTVSPATSETERNDLEVPDAVEDPIERTSHWPILVPMGIAQILVIAARQGRQIVIPLIGEGLGLDPGDIGLLVGIGTFTDFLLFPIAGYVMDRFGRLAAVVPAFSLVGIGLIWLATVDTYAGVAGAAALIGVGNSFRIGHHAHPVERHRSTPSDQPVLGHARSDPRLRQDRRADRGRGPGRHVRTRRIIGGAGCRVVHRRCHLRVRRRRDLPAPGAEDHPSSGGVTGSPLG